MERKKAAGVSLFGFIMEPIFFDPHRRSLRYIFCAGFLQQHILFDLYFFSDSIDEVDYAEKEGEGGICCLSTLEYLGGYLGGGGGGKVDR